MSQKLIIEIGIVLVLVMPFFAFGGAADLHSRFISPPEDARIMMRWWWFGPAVTKSGIDRELEIMKSGGIGGVEVQPTYPLILDDPLGDADATNQRWMSAEFLELLNHTAAKCKSMGMRMDLTLGSGWPYGGPMFSSAEGAARLEIVRSQFPAGTKSVPVPEIAGYHQVFAAFYANKELPITNGKVDVPRDAGGEVIFFINGRTRMQVKRPAFGAEGLVIDHLSKKVVEKFIREVAEPELKACGDNPPYAFFCDSLEVGGENWTDDFLAEFQKRRGYDLRPYLPALVEDIGEKTSAIRHDYAHTLTDIFNDNFNKPFQELAAKYKTRYRIQGYGSPAFGMYSYLTTDLAEGEAGGNGNWQNFRTTRLASSANHLLGRSVTSSETFTWLHNASFRATPMDIKGEVDTHFLDGVNQIICHGWPFTPAGVGYPGTSFYAAAVFNEKNPWYVAMPEISRYMQRISHILREGLPANDIALYLPDSDLWSKADTKYSSMNAVFTQTSPLVNELLAAGYNIDAFDDGILKARGKIDNGLLAFGDLRFKIIVLPNVTHLSIETARTLKAFLDGGGHVFATRQLPSIVPGLNATEAQHKELLEIMTQAILVHTEKDLPPAIARVLLPDVSLDEPDHAFGFVHRHTPDGEVYFLANTSDRKLAVNVNFRAGDLQPELWDVLSGKIKPLSYVARGSDSRKKIELSFEPYESKLVVWTTRNLPSKVDGQSQSQDISADWSVVFGSEQNQTILPQLQSWTKLPDRSHYSGVAVYEKKIDATSAMIGKTCLIHFGDAHSNKPEPDQTVRRPNGYVAEVSAPVRDAAVVYVNGRRAGAAWCAPFQVDLSGLIKEGENLIRIEVGNTAVNQIARDGFPNYDLAGLRLKYGNRFDPQNIEMLTQPLPSGLLGPIKLIWSE